jgi:hypothetical protein
MTSPLDGPFYTTRQVAKIVGFHLRTIMRWLHVRRHGFTPPRMQLANRAYRWTDEDIARLRGYILIHDLRKRNGIWMRRRKKNR